MDILEIINLFLRGLADSFHGFIYLPPLLLSFMRKSHVSKDKETEALRAAYIYSLYFALVSFALGMIISISVGAISEFLPTIFIYLFYAIAFTFRQVLVLLYKIGLTYLVGDMAKAIHVKKEGNPRDFTSKLVFISDSIFNIIVQFVFAMQLSLISCIPSIWFSYYPNTEHLFPFNGWPFYILMVGLKSIWYSLCVFEYKWYLLAWTLQKRFEYIEANWAYYMGFGSVYAMTTMYFESSWLNASIVGVLFSFYLYSAYEAEPQESEDITPLPVFQPSVATTNVLLKFFKWLFNWT